MKETRDNDHDVLLRVETKVDMMGKTLDKLNNKVDKTTFKWNISGISAVLFLIVTYLILFRGDIVANKTLLQELVKTHSVVSIQPPMNQQ